MVGRNYMGPVGKVLGEVLKTDGYSAEELAMHRTITMRLAQYHAARNVAFQIMTFFKRAGYSNAEAVAMRDEIWRNMPSGLQGRLGSQVRFVHCTPWWEQF